MKNTVPYEHPLSWRALIRIVLMGLAIILAWKASDAFVSILIAIVIAVSLHPVVMFVNKKTKIPVIFSIFLVILLMLIPFIIIGVSFIPALIRQFPDLIAFINSIILHSPFLPASWANLDIGQFLQAHFNSLLASTQTVAATFFNIITIMIMTIYFIFESDKLFNLLLGVFPSKERAKLREALLEIAEVTGKYIRGNLTVAFICGFVNFIGFMLIGLPFALPLAIFIGIFDLLPIVGQSIGGIPALIIGFSISPLKGILVLALNIAYQQTENAFIAPSIYKKVLKLYPAIIIVSVIMGASLFGVIGAFLALPTAAVIPVIIRYNKNYEERNATK